MSKINGHYVHGMAATPSSRPHRVVVVGGRWSPGGSGSAPSAGRLFYLVGLQNRLLVLIRWTVSFLTRGRGARLITGDRPDATGPPGGAAVAREGVSA